MFGRRTSTQSFTSGGFASSIPDGVPVLSRGKHRSPRKGACFMEMASFLAGEKWSDHPACTHPTLASLARCTNDALSDEARQQIVHLITDVVGLNPSDPRIVPALVLEAALAALPIAPYERQHVMALAIIAAERELNPTGLSRRSQEALAHAPEADTWARHYIATSGLSPQAIPRDAAGTVIALAIGGIAVAATADQREPERVLIALLERAIEVTRSFEPVVEPVVEPVAEQPRPERVASA